MALVMTMDLCCELQKIPNLLDHYAEHKASDGDSFWEFFVEDYVDDDAGENHHNENGHDNMPFHGTHQCQHANVLFSSTATFSMEVFLRPLAPFNTSYQFTFSSPYLEAPLQPPQFI